MMDMSYFSAFISLIAALFGVGGGQPIAANFQFTATNRVSAPVEQVYFESTKKQFIDKMASESNTVPSQNDSKVVNHSVSFTSQAPFGVWDELHGEACEEASMVMAVWYFRDQTLSPHLADQEFLKLVAWEEERGYTIDLTVQETVDVLEAYFGYTNTSIHGDVTVDAIKQELDRGHLVIIPAAGRELGNPYFTPPGPIYHMLVIRGYDDTTNEFITNDPGTRRGEAYRYSYQRLIGAIHDWNHERAVGGMTDAEMAQGRKVFISIGPEK